MKKTAIIAVLLWSSVLAACGAQANEKSPEELLSLSVSGLSGVDRYAFTGSTGIILASGDLSNHVTFQGTVEDHKRLKLNADGGGTAVQNDIGHPLELLKRIQESAEKTTLLSDSSGIRTAVLEIQANESASRREWEKNLRSEFDRLTGARIAQSGTSRIMAKADEDSSSLEQEMSAEVARSRKQLEKMLESLQVKTVYRLTVDRKRLLPLKLQENTEFRYRIGGVEQKEARKSEMTFQTK